MLELLKSLLSKKLGMAIGSISGLLCADYQATGTINWYTVVVCGAIAIAHIFAQMNVDTKKVMQAIVDGVKIVEQKEEKSDA